MISLGSKLLLDAQLVFVERRTVEGREGGAKKAMPNLELLP